MHLQPPYDFLPTLANPQAEGTAKVVRVLIVEDNPIDTEAMLRLLRKGGFDPRWECVTTEEEFLAALPRGFEVILADYHLPEFNGAEALRLLKKSGREIPFILVSGMIGEEIAVAAIKAGAADYLLKDRLARLGSAVAQALEQARLRQVCKQAQEDRRAREEAERTNLAKSSFLSRMSHELRTPLNAVLGFGQLLEMDTLEPAQASSVTYIVNAGRHLLTLVNEVLDLSRVETGDMEILLEELELTPLIAGVLALIRPLAAQRRLELSLCLDASQDERGTASLYVRADRKRLTQVLLNLLSNAVKYNAEGGSVRVDYQLTSERCRVRVADTGIGIPADKRERLFVPFDRLGAEGSSIQGTGLGLALSKKLMEAMGGQLGLEDHPSTQDSAAGSVFWIELARVECPDNARYTPESALARSRRHETAGLLETLLEQEDS